MKSEFLMLANDFNPKKHKYARKFMSEKLDGLRCFWDGGISRGLPCTEVPYANTAKHGRYVTPPLATGLWTRYCQPFCAPHWFLDSLPKFPLDGELTMGRRLHQTTKSVTKKLVPNHDEWEKVKFAVFEAPSLQAVLQNRKIDIPQLKLTISGAEEWVLKRPEIRCTSPFVNYLRVHAVLKDLLRSETTESWGAYLLPQTMTPDNEDAACEMVQKTLESITAAGAEGLMLREPDSYWAPYRFDALLKIKKLQDAEGIVVGYKWGKASDVERTVNNTATNKLLGLMGALTVRFGDVTFDLSGFTDSERTIVDKYGTVRDAQEYGAEHPGEVIDTNRFQSVAFPLESTVTFRFRELSDDGIPKEARYWRHA